MHLLETVVGLTSLIILSSILAHFLKRIPISLIQIVLGLGAAFLFRIEIELNTEWFLLLFIAPLLYSDAWRFPKRELWNLKGPIFGNAILLVFVTTVIGGFLIHLMIPAMPLPVAFAIAAILSPTDPVAVQSIAKQTKLPKPILHLVAGESLINDASGLVSFKIAIVAATVGTFSLAAATGEFLYSSFVGAVVGLVMGYFVNRLNDYLSILGHRDVILKIALQILSPFVIFILAEGIHASGVIAVVTGAIIANVHSQFDLDYDGETAVMGWNTWSVFSYFLNGFLFLILGIELPVATQITAGGGRPEQLGMLLLYAFGTWFVMFAIRFVWLYIGQAWRRRKAAGRPSFKMLLISSLSGVRGAITMAGVMSVPLVTETGAPFPERRMMLFIAATVIIISLVMASVLLPFLAGEDINLSQAEEVEEDKAPVGQVALHMTEPRARIYVLQSAIRQIEHPSFGVNRALVYTIITRYQAQIRKLQIQNFHSERLSKILEAEIKMRELTIAAERTKLHQMLDAHKISSFVYSSENRRLDRIEDDLHAMVTLRQSWSAHNLRHLILYGLRSIRIWFSNEDTPKLLYEYKLARTATGKMALTAIENYLADDLTPVTRVRQQALERIKVIYQLQIEQGTLPNSFENEAAAMKLEILGLTAQRRAVQHLYDAHFISQETSLNIRQTINFAETSLLVEE